MSPSKGRPPIDGEPKDKQYRLRMSKAEWERLENFCNSTGMSKAEIIRLGIEKVYQEFQKK